MGQAVSVGGGPAPWEKGRTASGTERDVTEPGILHPHPRGTVEWGFDRSAEVKFCKQPFTTRKKWSVFQKNRLIILRIYFLNP